MNLPKIHSITKKICVALVGGFLLLFLLFHMTANLFVLRHDDGAWYSAFCHFMGTNWIVKVFEVMLLGVLALHILLTLWLVVTNRLARPVRYHEAQRSKTHTSSKLMAYTGVLIFAFLVMHFCQFWFVKVGWVKGEYMVERERIETETVKLLSQSAGQYGMSADDFLDAMEEQMGAYMDELPPDQQAEMAREMEEMRAAAPVAALMAPENLSADGKWVRHIDYATRNMLKEKYPGCGVEPDFYFMVRQLFRNPLMVLLYLITFVALFLHMRHAFPSAFQTLGLNNYRYNGIIEWCGRIYTWLICLGFALVPVLVLLGV